MNKISVFHSYLDYLFSITHKNDIVKLSGYTGTSIKVHHFVRFKVHHFPYLNFYPCNVLIKTEIFGKEYSYSFKIYRQKNHNYLVLFRKYFNFSLFQNNNTFIISLHPTCILIKYPHSNTNAEWIFVKKHKVIQGTLAPWYYIFSYYILIELYY